MLRRAWWLETYIAHGILALGWPASKWRAARGRYTAVSMRKKTWWTSVATAADTPSALVKHPTTSRARRRGCTARNMLKAGWPTYVPTLKYILAAAHMTLAVGNRAGVHQPRVRLLYALATRTISGAAWCSTSELAARWWVVVKRHDGDSTGSNLPIAPSIAIWGTDSFALS